MRTSTTLLMICACCLCLTATKFASADFVCMVAEDKTDPDTADLCGQGNGPDVPGPLTVRNFSIQFDDDNDRLLSVAFTDVQVLNGGDPDVFYHHTFGLDVPYSCALLVPFPDLICDSYVVIGEKCSGIGATTPDGDFNTDPDDPDNPTDWFNDAGQIFGGWFNANPDNGLGDAVSYGDGRVLILQVAVAEGLTVEGTLNVFWQNIGDPKIFEEMLLDVAAAPGECGGGCQNDDECEDGNACTINTCEDGVCVSEPLDCNDDNECTDDDCDPGSGCTHENNNAGCQDGNMCTEGDQCSDGSCQPGGKKNCDDNDECTTDGCDMASGCTHEDVECNDNNDCTTDDCDAVDGCSNTPDCVEDTDCDDGLLCTTDTCTAEGCCENPAVECPLGEVCNPDNGNCEEGSCEKDSDCDDGNKCTADSCDKVMGCVNTPECVEDSDCDDGDACTDDTCSASGCCEHTEVNCDDDDACTTDGCDMDSGCTHEGVDCNDNNDCTTDDCDAVDGCSNTPDCEIDTDCDDGLLCTTDTCTPEGCCENTAVECPLGEVCNPDNGNCEEIPCENDSDCDDGNECTADSCDEVIGCVNTPDCAEDSDCDDDNACTDDTCSASGCCEHTDVHCDDGNDCTTDSCDPDSGCVYTPDCAEDGDCDDGNACTDDTCSASGCCEHTPVHCDDGNECTTDSCDPASGCVNTPDCTMDDGCDDKDACTTDTCSDSGCCEQIPVECEDDDLCTIDFCDPDYGCMHEPVECPEGTTCIDGECVGSCQQRTLIIKQGACPAPLNVNANGLVPMALIGDIDFAAETAVPASLRLRVCGTDGPYITPLGNQIKVKDLNHPFEGDVDCGGCACNDDQSSDGIDDLSLKFRMSQFGDVLGLGAQDGTVTLELTGELADGTPFCARDCIRVID